jgi:hypothetical protein
MPGLHICNVQPRGHDARGEWVQVANDGLLPSKLTGLELTDYTGTQQRPHIYRFPPLRTGADLTLRPRQSAFVFTGRGQNGLSDQGDWLLFAGRLAAVWNNSGDVAYLRDSKGRIIDSRTVGHPARHPNGH